MEEAGDAFLIHDGSGRVLEVNPKACDILGYPREELLSMSVQDIGAGVARPEADLLLARVIAGEQLRLEAQHRRKDGNAIPVEITLGALALLDGRAFLAVIRDLTRRTPQEDMYRQLIAAMNDTAFVISHEAKFLEVNERAVDMLGYSRTELLTMGPPDIDCRLTSEKIWELIDGIKAGERQVFDTQHRCKDGTVIPVEISSSPVSYKGRAAILSIARDVTERRRAQTMMEARLRLLELAGASTLERFLQATLDELETLTDSRIGFCNFLEADQETVTPQAWSTRTLRQYCEAGQGRKLSVSEAGVWADCIRQQRPVIHNDYASLPHRKGMPPGHAVLVRELAVPVFREDRIVAVFAVGNKPQEYVEHDVETVSSLADLAWDIAARKQVEIRLVESQARSRRLLDASPDAIFLTDETGRLLDCNQTALDRYGYTREELFQTVAGDLTAPDLRDRAGHWLAKALETGATYEWRQRRKDGSELPVEIRAVPMSVGGGQGFLSIVRDISERKQAEEALRKSQSLLSATGRMAKVGGWELDLQTQQVTWTDEVYRIHEVSEDFQPTAESAMGFYPLEARPAIDAAVHRAMEEGEGFDLEVPFVSAKGEKRWVHSIGEAQVVDGRIIAISGTIQDITERKQAEEALHDSEERFRGLSSMSTEGIMIHQDGVIVDANRAFAQLMGCEDADELVGKRGLETLPFTAESRERVEAHMRAHSSEAYEVELLRPDGSALWAETSGRAIMYRGVEARLVSMRDVTERKRAEAELRRSEEQLRQSQKMESVGRLAGGIAHDFNNMLYVILGHAELAMEQLDPHQPVFANLREIRDAANRSAGIAQQLLAFARRQPANPTLLDLNRSVEGMLEMLRRLMGEDIELGWQPGSDLGTVEVDPSQLDQILVNLCANARDAITGAGKVAIGTAPVTLDDAFSAAHEGCVPGDYVLLSLSDNGVGMDRETLEHVFEPFYTTKETGRGTGLGLATVYGIVKQNHGYIDVRSELRQGTTINIYLPRCTEPAAREEEKASGPVSPGDGETLLVVEDEPSVLGLAERVLARLGYRVLTARSPGEALRLAEAHPGEIALLITDVIMPEMSGWDLAERLAAERPKLKTLYVSGYAADVIPVRGPLKNGVRFLQKPFSPSDLGAGVRAALDQE